MLRAPPYGFIARSTRLLEGHVSDSTTSESASVLVITADPSIEALAGELVAYAGYRPMFDVTIGAAGESVRLHRPDIALVDTALPVPVVKSCVRAAEETGTRVVLMSSTASAEELRTEAAAEHCMHFILPGGPRQLGSVLERALDRGSGRPITAVPQTSARRVPGSVHPSLCAAIANVARARVLHARATIVRRENAQLLDEKREIMDETQRSRAALRAAVSDYVTQLRAARIPEDDALAQVHDTIAECASIVGARSDVDTLLADSEHWVRMAYRAA